MLDEPFSMVEPLYKIKIKEFLLKLTATKGIILTDHYYKDVLDVSTKNLVLVSGVAHPVESVEGLKAFGYLQE
jgi:ABC-type lipopolysaccharide export system ATPase subunit